MAAAQATGGSYVSDRRFGARDVVAILFVTITFAVIVAILWQNFLQID